MKKKYGVGKKFELKVRNDLKDFLMQNGGIQEKRILGDVPKNPDWFVFNKKDLKHPKVAIECKFVSKKGSRSQAQYWTMFSRGYALLHYLKIKHHGIKCFLVFNRKNKDNIDYYTMCKDIGIEFICLNKDKNIFFKKIKKAV